MTNYEYTMKLLNLVTLKAPVGEFETLYNKAYGVVYTDELMKAKQNYMAAITNDESYLVKEEDYEDEDESYSLSYSYDE